MFDSFLCLQVEVGWPAHTAFSSIVTLQTYNYVDSSASMRHWSKHQPKVPNITCGIIWSVDQISQILASRRLNSWTLIFFFLNTATIKRLILILILEIFFKITIILQKEIIKTLAPNSLARERQLLGWGQWMDVLVYISLHRLGNNCDPASHLRSLSL